MRCLSGFLDLSNGSSDYHLFCENRMTENLVVNSIVRRALMEAGDSNGPPQAKLWKTSVIILDLKAQDQHTIFHEVIKTAVQKQLIPAALAEISGVGSPLSRGNGTHGHWPLGSDSPCLPGGTR